MLANIPSLRLDYSWEESWRGARVMWWQCVLLHFILASLRFFRTV